MAQVDSRRHLARVRACVSHVGFMMGKVALGQVSHRVLPLFPVNIIPPWLSKPIGKYHGMNSSETSSHPIDMNSNNKEHELNAKQIIHC
jgi:hypothetical protein